VSGSQAVVGHLIRFPPASHPLCLVSGRILQEYTEHHASRLSLCVKRFKVKQDNFDYVGVSKRDRAV
jgi:hypothetical protein